MRAFERHFPPQPAELPSARAALKAWLHAEGVDERDPTEDVLIVTSELVTNGVLHDGGDLITLRADRHNGDVSIEVTTVDHLPGRHPTYRDVEDTADGGHGLAIVRALSHGYRVARHDHERVTTCQVPISSAGDQQRREPRRGQVGNAMTLTASLATERPAGAASRRGP
jgi:anti-sigma regulatory factor (Ser/Thr protein kinase)